MIGCQDKMEIKFTTVKLNSKKYIEAIDKQINTQIARINTFLLI